MDHWKLSYMVMLYLHSRETLLGPDFLSNMKNLLNFEIVSKIFDLKTKNQKRSGHVLFSFFSSEDSRIVFRKQKRVPEASTSKCDPKTNKV